MSGSTISGDADDFSLETGTVNTEARLVAGVNAKQNISLTVIPGKTSVSTVIAVNLSGTYDAEFERTPSLPNVAGTFTGTAAVADASEAATVQITSTGFLSGSLASGCAYTGVVEPRSDGNAYNVSLTFGGGACSNGTSTVTGVAYFNSGDRKLIAAGINGAENKGFGFVGTKP